MNSDAAEAQLCSLTILTRSMTPAIGRRSTDLLSGVARKSRLARGRYRWGGQRRSGRPSFRLNYATTASRRLEVGEITDDETAALSEENQALAIILSNDHPARGIARNLFYLSRMVELGAAQGEPAAAIATEMDLARLWWRYGGGRSEDDGRLARLKVLRAMGVQFVANPGRVVIQSR